MQGKGAALVAGALSSAAADPVPLDLGHEIKWTGSAWEKGDAFFVTAEIGEQAVEVKWDGFAGPHFAFMDEAEKKRSQRSYRFEDPATVDAFRSLARHSEWADVGGPMALGQGVAVEAEVRNRDRELVRSMYYFATPTKYVLANRFERIPWDVKRLVDADDQAAARTAFSKSLVAFARELVRRGTLLQLVEEAYQAEGKFPHEAFSTFAEVPTHAEFTEIHGDRFEPEQGQVDQLLGVVGGALKDCLDPRRRGVLLGGDLGGGGCLVQVDGMAWGHKFSVITARLREESESPHYRMLSKRATELLLRFISGGEEVGHAVLHISGKLKWTKGGLEVVKGDAGFGAQDPELTPGMNRRLAWLNEQGPFRILSKELNGGVEGLVGLLHFDAVRVHPHDAGWVKLDYSFRGEEYVVEARLKDGVWTPEKRWGWEEYYFIDGVYHNGHEFRGQGTPLLPEK